MTECEQCQDEFPELVSGVLAGEAADRVRAHVSGCGSCEKALREISTVRKGIMELASEPVPAELRRQVLAMVHAELEAERKPVVGLSPGRLVAAVASGLAAVLVHLAILQGRADFSGIGSTQLIAVAAAWCALSIAAFSWVLGRYRLGAVDLESSGLFGLLTSGVAALGILFCPQETYFVLWEGSALSHTIVEQLGPGASYGLFGVLYGVPPALVISAALAKSGYGGTDRGLIGAGMATLLWLPAAYLQCSALALGLLLAWAAGTLAGVSGGFWFGVGVRRLVTVTGR